ncbi:hypothetical protein DL96DRAFT_1565268 [Flagelloscypha sp. PMI_526]|nr:hypothetical protein DL96DRAFT_1565268 [Flagelloscypha sp. PMI_526]
MDWSLPTSLPFLPLPSILSNNFERVKTTTSPSQKNLSAVYHITLPVSAYWIFLNSRPFNDSKSDRNEMLSIIIGRTVVDTIKQDLIPFFPPTLKPSANIETHNYVEDEGDEDSLPRKVPWA